MATGNPSDALLQRVQEWPHTEGFGPLLDLVRECWKYDAVSQRGRRWRFSTLGWSGNEALIGALRRNALFWLTCWQSSHRGGLHVFQVPR